MPRYPDDGKSWNKYLGRYPDDGKSWHRYLGRYLGDGKSWNRYLGRYPDDGKSWNRYLGLGTLTMANPGLGRQFYTAFIRTPFRKRSLGKFGELQTNRYLDRYPRQVP